MRDIESYSQKYLEPGFERYKVLYRRKKIEEIIRFYHPQSILEIGCGLHPLFQYIEKIRFTVVEPSDEFFENAQKMVDDKNRIHILQGFFEDVAEKLSDEYDMIICSSLLHEVEEPTSLLKAIAHVCRKDTIVHINVPNANSMHRLLGKEMGILRNVTDMTQNNIDFQQNNVFDKISLCGLIERNGFQILEEGSYFIKPFSHKQMELMLEKKIIDEEVLDGLYRIGKYMPEFASEIYVNCKVKSVE